MAKETLVQWFGDRDLKEKDQGKEINKVKQKDLIIQIKENNILMDWVISLSADRSPLGWLSDRRYWSILVETALSLTYNPRYKFYRSDKLHIMNVTSNVDKNCT